MPNAKKQDGFTLIEIIIVIIITSILVASSSNLLAEGFRSFITTRELLVENKQTMLTLETLVRDLQNIRSPRDISSANSSQITFNDTTGNTITYTQSGNILSRTEVNETQNDTQTVAENLTFSLEYDASNGTNITDTDTNSANIPNIRYITVNLGSDSPSVTVQPWNLR